MRHRLHRHGFENGGARRIPIMSILLNNLDGDRAAHHEGSTEKYRSTTSPATMPPWRAPSAAMAAVTKRGHHSAIKRGIEQTKKGVPVLLEFITSKESRSRVPK